MKRFAAGLFLFFSVYFVFGQTTVVYDAYVKKADSLFELQEYKNALEVFENAFALMDDKGRIEDHYKAARAYALIGDADGAFKQLFRITNKTSFNDYNRVAKEWDFMNLRGDGRWNTLVAILKITGLSNLGFEQVNDASVIPKPWFQWGNENYKLSLDSVIKHSGKYAMRIEPNGELKSEDFGSVDVAIPADYEGDDIEVRAYIKFENTVNPIGLLLREDGTNGTGILEFNNMMGKMIKGTKDWTLYKVKLPLRTAAKTIYIGAILKGPGTLWVDDFEVLIDGRDISHALRKRK